MKSRWKIPVKNTFFIICLLGLVYVVITIVNIVGYVSDQITDSVKLGLITILCVIGFTSGRDFFRFTRTTPIFLAAMSSSGHSGYKNSDVRS